MNDLSNHYFFFIKHMTHFLQSILSSQIIFSKIAEGFFGVENNTRVM